MVARPAVAPQRTLNLGALPYPTNIEGETLEIAMANALTAMGAAPSEVLASCVGQGGADITVIQKGGSGPAYAAGLRELTVASTKLGVSVIVACISLRHGEADSQNENLGYQTAVDTLQTNYQADVVTSGGFLDRPTLPMVFTAQASQPGGFVGNNTSVSLAALLALSQAHPTRFIYAGPDYQDPNFDAQHKSEYRREGEKQAQALAHWRSTGSWSPLWMTSVGRVGAVVTITWNVPVGPLAFDTSKGQPHQVGHVVLDVGAGKGHEAYDNYLSIVGSTGNGASPIVLQLAPGHTLITGDTVAVFGLNHTVADGMHVVTVVDSTHVSLNGTTGTGGYITGPAGAAILRPITINSVAISGNTTVMTLANTPSTNFQVGYANTQDNGVTVVQGGFPSGRCGCLRDSDPYVGASGIANQNWGVPFTVAVP